MGHKHDRRTPGQKNSESNKRRRKEDRQRILENRAAALGIHVDELKRRDTIAADARRASRQIISVERYYSPSQMRL
jgi:hypothetical protein